MTQIERRSMQLHQAEGKITVTIPFNSLSEDLGGFRERIDPQAFTRTLGDTGADVMAFWNHDSGKPLARRSNGTLDLAADSTALTARIQGDQASWSEDARASVAAGTVKGASFGFMTQSDRWDRISGEWRRTLLDVDLVEVSPTPAPAYPASAATAN